MKNGIENVFNQAFYVLRLDASGLILIGQLLLTLPQNSFHIILTLIL